MNLLSQLTPRHIEVAHLVARGLENKEIGFALGITDITVRNHLKEIFLRLKIHNRTQLARLVLLLWHA